MRYVPKAVRVRFPFAVCLAVEGVFDLGFHVVRQVLLHLNGSQRFMGLSVVDPVVVKGRQAGRALAVLSHVQDTLNKGKLVVALILLARGRDCVGALLAKVNVVGL